MERSGLGKIPVPNSEAPYRLREGACFACPSEVGACETAHAATIGSAPARSQCLRSRGHGHKACQACPRDPVRTRFAGTPGVLKPLQHRIALEAGPQATSRTGLYL